MGNRRHRSTDCGRLRAGSGNNLKITDTLDQRAASGAPGTIGANNTMGKILYGESGVEIVFDDRAMAHLQLVIGAKLRRGEGFFFSWKDDPSVGDGRSSIWIDTGIPLYFKYLGSRPVSINREWIEALTLSANLTGGLQFVGEPGGDTTNPKSNVQPRFESPPGR